MPGEADKAVKADAALALNDVQLAQDRLKQAQRMEAEARGLLAESARLKAEAEAAVPEPTKKVSKKAAEAPTEKKDLAEIMGNWATDDD